MKASITVDWFEIYVSDLPRAVTFYEALFDVQLKQEQAGDISMAVFPCTEGQTGGSLTHMPSLPHQPGAAGTIVYLDVPCLQSARDKVVALGGEIVLPLKDVGCCDIALFRDTEGNIVGLCTHHA